MYTKILFLSLNAVAILNIVVLCFFLCFRKKNIKPNYVLAFIFTIPGLYFVDNVLICTDLISKVPYAFFAVQILANLFPIAVYYYTHLLLTDKKKYHPFLLLGSVITFIYSISLSIYFSGLGIQEQLNYLNQLLSENYPMSMNIYNILFYILQMFYLLVLYKEIKQYQKHVESKLANFDDVKLVFIKQFITTLAILNFSLVLFYIFLPMPLVDYAILPLVITIIYVFIIYFTVKNNALFSIESYQQLQADNEAIFLVDAVFQNMHDISELEVSNQEIIGKINTALYTDKIYRIPNLKLSDISEKINEQPHLISQVLNSHFKKTFYEMINDLRVEEAKLLLPHFDSKKETIENIGYKVGFNSRASFYRVFKKTTGKIPTDFVSSS